jgi:hypothetical protein
MKNLMRLRGSKMMITLLTTLLFGVPYSISHSEETRAPLEITQLTDRDRFSKVIVEFSDSVRNCGVEFQNPRLVDNGDVIRAAYDTSNNTVNVGYWESLTPEQIALYESRENLIRNKFESIRSERSYIFDIYSP